MGCREFLEGYSDFFDGRLGEPELSRYRSHLLTCRRCAEYDRVLRRGLQIVRELEPPAADSDLVSLLEPDLLERRAPRRDAGELRTAGVVAGLAVAAAAFAVSLPALRSGRAVELPPVVVEAPAAPGDLPSLWGPPRGYITGASFLQAPDFSQYRSRISPNQPYSLFRTRTPAVEPAHEVAEAEPVAETETARGE